MVLNANGGGSIAFSVTVPDASMLFIFLLFEKKHICLMVNVPIFSSSYCTVFIHSMQMLRR